MTGDRIELMVRYTVVPAIGVLVWYILPGGDVGMQWFPYK